MVFNSLNFLAFFAVVYALYRVLPHRGQNALLLVASYAFYAAWDWRFLSLLLLSTVVDFVLAQLIDRSDSPVARRRLLSLSMCVSLGILGFFKYFNFFEDNLVQLLARFGWDARPLHLDIILPWGISFYTFQTMNYTIDVYRRHLAPSRNLFEFAVFVSFFPHLVAGPIMRASVLLPQIQQARIVTAAQLREGLWLFVWGLFKKIVVADNLAVLVDAGFRADAAHSLGGLLVAVYAFAFQIYGDFSGYSDMARGISKLMGIELMVNFQNPYFAVNPSDFWRRWHISLSTWLRDYLYIPLGGNRRGRVRTYVNLTVTMLLGGLWHGANWTFVFWGAFHGLFLAAHRLLCGEERRQARKPAWQRVVYAMLMFHAVCFGWLLFRAQSMAEVGAMLAGAWAQPVLGGVFWSGLSTLALLAMPMLFLEWLHELAQDDLVVLRFSPWVRATVYAGVLALLAAWGNTGSMTFIYFQF